MRLRGLVFAGSLLLGACDHYAVLSTNGPTTSVPPGGQRAYDTVVGPNDLYTVMWAEVTPPQGTIPPCADDIYSAMVRSRQRIITVTANVTKDLSLPLYSASQDGSQKCSITYSQIYLTPRQLVDSSLPLTITMSSTIDDTGNERFTEYLKAGTAFASLLSPISPQVGAVTAAMSTALNSQEAKTLSGLSNSFMKSAVAIEGPPLVSFSPPIDGNWNKTEIQRPLVLRRLDYGNKPYNEPDTPLGSVTVTVLRTATVIGRDPITDGKPLGSLPSYDNVNQYVTVLFTFSPGVRGAIAVQANLYNLLNDKARVADTLKSLTASSDEGQVDLACGNVRKAIADLGALNRIDAAVYLWYIYSLSPYARTKETAQSLDSSACLTVEEVTLVRALHLEKWLRSRPPTA